MSEDRSVYKCSEAAARNRRDRIELCVGYGLILLVIWTPGPLQRLLYYIAIVVLGAILWRSFDSWADLGLRTANLLQSIWVVGAALVVATAAVICAIRLHTLHVPDGTALFLKRYIGYAVWSFAQQILLLDFFLRRFMRLLPGKKSAVDSNGGHLRAGASAEPHPHSADAALGPGCLPALPAIPQSFYLGHGARHLRYLHCGYRSGSGQTTICGLGWDICRIARSATIIATRATISCPRMRA